jgi:hypothetical protein
MKLKINQEIIGTVNAKRKESKKDKCLILQGK